MTFEGYDWLLDWDKDGIAKRLDPWLKKKGCDNDFIRSMLVGCSNCLYYGVVFWLILGLVILGLGYVIGHFTEKVNVMHPLIIILLGALPGIIALFLASRKVVKARSFVVFDAAGKARALFGIIPDGSESVSLALFDKMDRLMASLIVDAEGAPRLALYGAAGKPRLMLGLSSEDLPKIALCDSEGKPREMLGVLTDGSTELVFAGADGLPKAVLGTNPNDTPILLMYDALGEARVLIYTDSDNQPCIQLRDQDGDELFSAP